MTVAKKPSSWSFRSLVFLQNALIAAAPLAIAALIGWRVVVPQITTAVEQHHQALTRATAVQVDTHLASARRELSATVALVEAVPRNASQARLDNMRSEAIDRILDATVGNGSLYETIYIAGHDAIVHAVGLPGARRVARRDLKGIDLSRREFVMQAMQSGEPVWSTSFLSAVSGRLSVALAMPAPSGVLVAELALVQFSHFLRDLPADKSAIALILDRRGYVVAHPRPDVAGQQVSLSDQDLIRDGFGRGTAIGNVRFEGRDMIGALQTIPGVNWAVLVAQPEASAFRLLDSVVLSMLVGFAVSIVIALAAAYLIARGNAARVRAYAQNAAALADGRYDLVWPSTRITEFVRLADDLQRMSQSIRDREASLMSSEARYREVVQSSADLITEVDAEGRFLFVNETAANIYGMPAEQCRGRIAFDFVHPDDRTATQQAFLRWLASPSDSMQIENRQVGVDGKVYSIVWSIHAHRAVDGEILEFSSIGHDMTEYRRAEAEVRRLALVASATSNAVLITGADGKVEWVNAACEQMTGFSRDELQGAGPWAGRIGPGSPDALVAWMSAELLAGRGFNAVEVSFVRRDGEARWHEVEVQPVRDERGRLIQSVVIESDVTARRQAEEARKSSEERLRATLENTPNVAIQWYDASGVVTYWNRSSERLFGIPAAQAIGRPGGEVFGELFGPPSASGFLGDAMEQIDATGEAVGPFESTMRRPDGSTGCILSTTFAIPGSGGGRTYVCMDIDISEQKALLAALTASEQKFLAVFQSSPVPIVVSHFGSKIEIVDCNVAWERQFGYRRDNVVGRSGPEIGYWVDMAQREVMLARLEAGGMVEDMEVMIRKAGGATVVCLASGQLITLGNERLAVVAYRDVTEERHNAQALRELNAGLEDRVAERTAALAAANNELRHALDTLQRAQSELIRSEKLAALGSLVAGVAHELNTPIGNGLMAATTLDDHTAEFGRVLESGSIRRSTLDAFVRDARTAAAIVVRNLHKASELVTSFKQVAVDQTSAQRREFALAEVVSEIVLTLRPTFRKTPYTVDYDVPADLRLDSYPGPLGQVFSNLINNALLHGFEGRDHGAVTIVATAAGDGWVRLSIADDGCGIDREHLPRVFDPFFTTKLGKGGSGLGLHIVHNIVTRVLGGELRVDSDASGTRFTIDIPCKAPRKVSTDAF